MHKLNQMKLKPSLGTFYTLRQGRPIPQLLGLHDTKAEAARL